MTTFIPENERSAPAPLRHCRICHQDTDDYRKHFHRYHEASGGFGADCEIVQCQKWRAEHP